MYFSLQHLQFKNKYVTTFDYLTQPRPQGFLGFILGGFRPNKWGPGCSGRSHNMDYLITNPLTLDIIFAKMAAFWLLLEMVN